MTVTMQISRYVKKRHYGSIFSFKQVLHKVDASKRTVYYAVNQLTQTNAIVRVKKGIYLRPKMSRFGPILPEPGQIAVIMAKNIGAKLYPSGANAVNALGLSTQLSMNYSYVATKQMTSFEVNNSMVNIRYSRALETAERKLTGLKAKEKEKIILLWLSFEYLGKREIYLRKDEIIHQIGSLSSKGHLKFEQILSGKLHWAKTLITMEIS